MSVSTKKDKRKQGIIIGIYGGRVILEKAETVDLIDILFEEKAHLDEVYRANGSFSYTPMVLSEISYSYAVYFDASGSFYLVPLCEVRYAGGDVRTYNCVSGKLYS